MKAKDHTAKPAAGSRTELPSQRWSVGENGLVHGAVGHLSYDESSQQNVCAALLAAQGLDARDIEVSLDRDCVTLRGSVATRQDLDNALGIARRCAGVRSVRSALRVRAPEEGADASASRSSGPVSPPGMHDRQ